MARKRRLQEAESEQPASKRKSHPLKLAMDEGFNAESEGSGEETVLREEDEEDEEQAPQAGDQEREEEEQAKHNTESINTEEEGGDEGEGCKLNQNMIVSLVWDNKNNYVHTQGMYPECLRYILRANSIDLCRIKQNCTSQLVDCHIIDICMTSAGYFLGYSLLSLLELQTLSR